MVVLRTEHTGQPKRSGEEEPQTPLGCAVHARTRPASGFARVILDREIKVLFSEHPKSSGGDPTGHFSLPNVPSVRPFPWPALPHVVWRPLQPEAPGARPVSKGGGHIEGAPRGLCRVEQAEQKRPCLGQQFSKAQGARRGAPRGHGKGLKAIELLSRDRPGGK